MLTLKLACDSTQSELIAFQENQREHNTLTNEDRPPVESDILDENSENSSRNSNIITGGSHDSKNIEQQTNVNMSQKENREFLRFAAQTLNKNYSGDPLTLQSFINSVDLITMAAEIGQQDLLKKFVTSRLDGKALESIDTSESLDQIIEALKKAIRPDSSKVVKGKILSLRFKSAHAVDFSKQAEELAESLQRSLVVEGYSLAKAKEITIERTVEMCRQNAKNEFVKSVLAAREFKDPKKVVAKLFVEQNSQDKEKQVLIYNKTNYNRQNKPFFRRNGNNFNRGQ